MYYLSPILGGAKFMQIHCTLVQSTVQCTYSARQQIIFPSQHRRGIILQEANPMSGLFQNIDPPPPTAGRVCTPAPPPPPLVRGGGHTR